jgi:hypothetical protein
VAVGGGMQLFFVSAVISDKPVNQGCCDRIPMNLGETEQRCYQRMKTIPRILIAVLASFLFNILLVIVLSVADRKGNPSRFWRFVDAIAEPPTFVANALFQSLAPTKMAFAWMAVSIVYFAVVIWIGMALFSFFHTSTHVKP